LGLNTANSKRISKSKHYVLIKEEKLNNGELFFSGKMEILSMLKFPLLSYLILKWKTETFPIRESSEARIISELQPSTT
jgi:hypothetical protein